MESPTTTSKLPPPPWMTFGIGAVAGALAWTPVHPLDVLKTRMQLSKLSKPPLYTGVVNAASTIVRKEGIRALYSGISAGYTRTLSYTTLRTGLYQILKDAVGGGDVPSSFQRVLCGFASGGSAALLCCPIEVSLVRMQADGRLPIAQQRGYTHVFNALGRIVREEGFLTLYRGATPTVVRAMVVNSVQMSSFDFSKQFYSTHFALQGVRGVLGPLCSPPRRSSSSRSPSRRTGTRFSVLSLYSVVLVRLPVC
eukprot:GHVU01132025.1.p1 GENE.GHVU01132025.1~~GHVU01132025.1.p1  ORF type:complete len:253 (-),score=26.98 GHVU01132025.1:466-1224(-)